MVNPIQLPMHKLQMSEEYENDMEKSIFPAAN
jgi:hypothetical protein